MSYDNEKDICVEEIAQVPSSKEGQTIKIGMYSYNGGEQKLGLNRCYTKRDGTVSTGSIGRMTVLEAKRVTKALLKYFKK